MNFTLTITATPELLGAINNLAGTIGGSKAPSLLASAEAITEITAHPHTHEMQYGVQQQQPIQQPQSTAQTSIPNYQQPGAVPMSQQPVPTYQQPMQQQQQPIPGSAPIQNSAQQSAVPTTSQSYAMEQLAVAATQLVDAGRRTELVSLLSSFGVQALTALPKEQYGAFATQLRSMGAKI